MNERINVQVRDLMVFIEAQRTLEGNAELRDGAVFAVPAPPAKTPTSSRRRR
jgi:hypothetical protein